MKYITKLLPLMTALTLFAACDKADDLPFYGKGNTVALTSSVASVAAAPADSLNEVIKFTWTSPNYAAAPTSYKYILQLDTAGGNFVKGYSKVITGVDTTGLSTGMTAKEINNILLGYGFQFGVAYDMIARLVSSYGNNNEQYISNTVALKMTPYKVPPKVAVPASGTLFIVGDATYGDWSNPVPTPAQEFSRIDETTWGGVFNLIGGGTYLLLPENGNWGKKYAIADDGLPGVEAAGDFGYYESGGSNIPGPAVDGLYKITVDFQTGKYTVVPFTQQHGLPSQLVAVGGGTDQDWNNSADNPLRFTRLNSTEFSLTLNLKAGGEYLLLPTPTVWDKYGVNDNSIDAAKLEGTIKPEGSNFRTPDADGVYKILVNFYNGHYKVTKQ